MRILKFNLSLTGGTLLSISKYAKVLAVKNQRESLVVYVQDCGASTDFKAVSFYSYMTGESFITAGEYLDTVLFAEGGFVVHVYWKDGE